MSEVHTRPEDVEVAPSVVTIGNFDGVHRGHQVLVRRCVDSARERGVRAVAITFEPHPAAVLKPGSEPPRLQTVEDRVAALYEGGVDLVMVLPFSTETARLGPHVFLEQVLLSHLQAVKVIVGTNFRFGHRAAGDVLTLTEAGETYGFETEAVTLLELDGVRVSSSEIRARLRDGDVAWATKALGRPYRIVGPVVSGDGRGRTIGVPTANVEPEQGLLVPGRGVYAGWLQADGERWPAVTNVGTRPTFDGTGTTVEAHALDADVELYGRRVAVTFEHRLRDEVRFDGPDELVAQIRRDLDDGRRALGVDAGRA